MPTEPTPLVHDVWAASYVRNSSHPLPPHPHHYRSAKQQETYWAISQPFPHPLQLFYRYEITRAVCITYSTSLCISCVLFSYHTMSKWQKICQRMCHMLTIKISFENKAQMLIKTCTEELNCSIFYLKDKLLTSLTIQTLHFLTTNMKQTGHSCETSLFFPFLEIISIQYKGWASFYWETEHMLHLNI